MAAQPNITRRAAFVGAFAASAAAIPAVALAAAPDPQAEKDAALIRFLKSGEPADLITYHSMQLARAMQAARPGEWRAVSDIDNGFALVVRDGDGDSVWLDNRANSRSRLNT